jgi:hypothetical protein
MLQEEILERNKEIALMLGWKEATLEYKMKWCAVPTEDRLIRLNQLYVPFLMKENNEPLFEDTMYWSESWNSLMDAVGFIKQNLRTSEDTADAKVGEYFIDEWSFGVKSYYIRLIQWTDNGWRMFDGVNRDLSFYYIIGENCQSEKEAIFLAVSDLAKLYNK